MQPLQDMQICDDPKKGLHDVRSFVGACNFYRHHIHNFVVGSFPGNSTCTPVPLRFSKSKIPNRQASQDLYTGHQ